MLDSVVNSVSKKFFENFTADDAKLGVSVLVEDTGRKSFIRIMQSVWGQGFIGSCYKFQLYQTDEYCKNNIVPISFLVINFLLLFCWEKPNQCFFHFCVAFFGHMGVIFRSSHYIAVTEPL